MPSSANARSWPNWAISSAWVVTSSKLVNRRPTASQYSPVFGAIHCCCTPPGVMGRVPSRIASTSPMAWGGAVWPGAGGAASASSGKPSTWSCAGSAIVRLYPKPAISPVTNSAGGPPSGASSWAKTNSDGSPARSWAYEPMAASAKLSALTTAKPSYW